MRNSEVLVLHGSPGSGKSTLARALFEYFRISDRAVAVIDPDELNLIHPDQGRAFWLSNLRSIWANYTTVDSLRAIVPTVIADAEDRARLQDALPASRFVICELMAPKDVLKHRVSAREPNEFWREQLERWVDVYHDRDEGQKFGDFQVATYDKTIDETVIEILDKAGWRER
jgi:tRNA uridine 5-carbamoylmethylation protein Kti12